MPFTKALGETPTTKSRKDALRVILSGRDVGEKRFTLALYAWENGAEEYFDDQDQVYHFLKPGVRRYIFDGIGSGQN